MRRRSALTAVIVVALLSACATTAPEAVAPTASPAPNASETESAPIAVTLEFDALGVRLLDATDEALIDVDYLDEPAELIAQLSLAFGHEPTVTSSAATGDISAATNYDWAGFTLSDEEVQITRSFYVTATAAAVGSIAIRTTEGFVVGMTEADLMASGATLFASAALRTY